MNRTAVAVYAAVLYAAVTPVSLSLHRPAPSFPLFLYYAVAASVCRLCLCIALLSHPSHTFLYPYAATGCICNYICNQGCICNNTCNCNKHICCYVTIPKLQFPPLSRRHVHCASLSTLPLSVCHHCITLSM